MNKQFALILDEDDLRTGIANVHDFSDLRRACRDKVMYATVVIFQSKLGVRRKVLKNRFGKEDK